MTFPKVVSRVTYEIPSDRAAEAVGWFSDFFQVPAEADGGKTVFNIRGVEVNLITVEGSIPEPASPFIGCYWRLGSQEELLAFYDLFKDHGAIEPKEVGGGVWVATLQEPFGKNIIGMVFNPGFKWQLTQAELIALRAQCSASGIATHMTDVGRGEEEVRIRLVSDEEISTPLRGVGTVIYHTNDMEVSSTWLQEITGLVPNFSAPFYTGMTTYGGQEIGVMPAKVSRFAPGSTQAIAWSVTDLDAVARRMCDRGASASKVIEVGEDAFAVQVTDISGNVFELEQNPAVELVLTPSDISRGEVAGIDAVVQHHAMASVMIHEAAEGEGSASPSP